MDLCTPSLRYYSVMHQQAVSAPAYVIKPDELLALNFLEPDYPRPADAEWINRGTDQKLRQSTIDMLQRTLFKDMAAPSVVELHRSAGLRVIFASEAQRQEFAAAFARARETEIRKREASVTAVFDDREAAETAAEVLVEAGFPKECISILWRLNQLSDTNVAKDQGHTVMSVASAVAGSGFAGALLGVAVLAIPGIGPIAAAGAIAAAAPSVAGVSGVIGATGGAIARMLDDHDVEGIAANHFEQQIRRGKVFVSVDVRETGLDRDVARRLLKLQGGRAAVRG